MFSRMSITKSTGSCSDNVNRLREALDKADAVVVGAGAGLSTSAGFTYSGDRFRRYFADFEKKYGFHDMYSGAFCRYDTPEEHWAYWSRFITINRYMDAPKPVYEQVFDLVREKDYFIITTNVDHCFQKAGVDKKRLFYTQGDYGLFQCSKPCCQETFDNEDMIRQMMEQQKAAERYENFLRTRRNGRILFLELGVGYNTPVIIKYPFWHMTAQNKAAVYACINYGEAVCPTEIEKQSICINEDISSVIADIKQSI